MYRPSRNDAYQRAVYPEHKGVKCLIYQSITTPDGLMFSFYGPMKRRHHDLKILRESGWSDILHDRRLDGWYYIYGDSAYLLWSWMQRPFISGICSFQEEPFNTKMSEVCVAVENSYRDLKHL